MHYWNNGIDLKVQAFLLTYNMLEYTGHFNANGLMHTIVYNKQVHAFEFAFHHNSISHIFAIAIVSMTLKYNCSVFAFIKSFCWCHSAWLIYAKTIPTFCYNSNIYLAFWCRDVLNFWVNKKRKMACRFYTKFCATHGSQREKPVSGQITFLTVTSICVIN